MIAKMYLEGRKVFGNDPWDIEIADADMTFIEMLHSPEMYIPHHVLEWKYSSKELQTMERYDKVSPDELIWVKDKTHFKNKVIHKGVIEGNNKISKALKGRGTKKGIPHSEFGDKFKEHFGITYNDNIKLYKREREWFRRYGHCRWE